MSPRSDDLAQLAAQTLDGVGGVDELAHLWRKGKERHHPIPSPAPGLDHSRVALTPGALLEGRQLGLGGLRVDGRVDGLERCSQLPALLPAGILQAVADQVHDAGLQRRGRKHRLQRLGNPLEAIGHGNQDIGHAPVAQIVENLHPETCTFGVLDPKTQHVAAAIGQDAQRQVHCLVAHHAAFPDLDPQRIEEHHRVHGLQRPGLPGLDLLHDLIGHGADELGADLGAVLLHQQALDLPYRHAPGVHGHDPLIEALEAPLVLRNQDRLEAALTVPRGTSICSGPSSVSTVLALLPFR